MCGAVLSLPIHLPVVSVNILTFKCPRLWIRGECQVINFGVNFANTIIRFCSYLRPVILSSLRMKPICPGGQ
jgi:hypothetical protein